MYDAGKIIVGLVIFLVLVTSPLWYNLVSGSPVTAPELQYPTDSTQCVEAKDYMRASNMDLLNAVVREGRRDHVSALTGKSYDMSLSRTCMDCHDNKAQFCDACHTYMAVTPYCWDCHVEPKEVQ